MAIIYDARGNEIKVSFPDSVTNEVIADGRTITAVLGAANAEVIMDLNGAQTATYDVRTAAASLTYVFEGTTDGTNYFGLSAFVVSSVITAAISAEVFVSSVTVTTTATALYTVGVTGLRRVRIRVSAYTSGNITVAARGSQADLMIYGKPIPTTLWVTVTAAVNTAATITLASAGAGLFHYITHIQTTRTAAAAIVGTGTLITTSTNLPGSPAWTFGNALAVGASQKDIDVVFSNPLKSLLANTATTIVIPNPGATALNRGNCGYYIGA